MWSLVCCEPRAAHLSADSSRLARGDRQAKIGNHAQQSGVLPGYSRIEVDRDLSEKMLKTQSDAALPDITNWLASLKQQTGEGGGWEFDSVSGISSDLMSPTSATFTTTATYNISPSKDSSTLATPTVQYSDPHDIPTVAQDCTASIRAVNLHGTGSSSSEWLQQMTMMTINPSHLPRFQYIVMASTAPGTRCVEETLTYLNQGQPYEMKLKKLSTGAGSEFYKSVVRVVFHERRLQYVEREQLDLWRQMRPGERIVDIDIPLSYGVADVKIDPHHLNSFEVKWNANRDTGIFIKVHCISTEFTQRKHGGEKGVPFRIQVETYELDGPQRTEESRLVHCASCKVNVFKPKGADRKQKRDQERMEKTTDVERAKFHPTFPCTELLDIPLDQVLNYLIQLRKHDNELAQQSCTELPAPPADLSFLHSPASMHQSGMPMLAPDALSNVRMNGSNAGTTKNSINNNNNNYALNDLNSCDLRPRNRIEDQTLQRTQSPLSPSPLSRPMLPKLSLPPSFMQSPVARSPQLSLSSPRSEESDVLLSSFTASQVTNWLQRRRFGNYVGHFQNYFGADLLCLSREDLIQLCGLADGIRLNNALKTRILRPKLTIYICQVHSAVEANSDGSMKKTQSWNLDRLMQSARLSSIGHDDSPESMGSDSCYDNKYQFEQPGGSLLNRTLSVGSFTPPLIGAGRLRTAASVPIRPRLHITGTKRQLDDIHRNDYDSDDGDEFASLKKQRCMLGSGKCDQFTADRDRLYYALYLDVLTSQHFTEKLSTLFGISPTQILQINMRGPSGIQVLVTDAVVQNFVDESQYAVQIIPDVSGQYHFVMQPVH